MDKARYQIACSWFFSSVSADFFSMNFQAISSSSAEPDSKPRESWKIKLHPEYVIWCSISCRPRCYQWVHAYHIVIWRPHLKWWYQMICWLFKLITWKKLNNKRNLKSQTDLPSFPYMIGFVPFATPQTFSRMVVLPALALPMTRMRKCGHR